MSRWFLLVLVACEKSHPAPPAVGSAAPAVARVVAADAAVPDLPPPWREVPEPTQEQLMCANADASWIVSTDAKGVHVAKQTVPEPDTGPALPFKPTGIADGVRHTLAVSDGFLVGIYGGEFGGSLDWFSKDGKKHASLGTPNVMGLARLGDDEVLVLTGLNHLGLQEGTARWFDRDATGWHRGTSAKLAGGPMALVDTGDAVYTVTPNSVVRIDRDHNVEVIASPQVGLLYPESMALDAQRRVWIGMRAFVMKIDADRKVTWYAAATPCASSG